jgi:hypothetical protein
MDGINFSILTCDLLGIVLGTLLSFVPLVFFLCMIILCRNKPPLVLLSAGYLLATVGSVEGTPTMVITSIRDFVLFAVVYLVAEQIVRLFLATPKASTPQ